MANKKLFLTERDRQDYNLKSAMELLTDKLDILERKHPDFTNMVLIGGMSWWIATSSSNTGINLTQTESQNALDVIEDIKSVLSGLMIVRQMKNYRICVYFITDLDKVAETIQDNGLLDWDTVEKLKIFADSGEITEADECTGFHLLKNRRRDQDRVLMSPTEV